jgi:hypothetical protein
MRNGSRAQRGEHIIMLNGSGTAERRELARLFDEQDRMMEAAREEARQKKLMRRADPVSGLVFRDAPAPAVDIDEENRKNQEGWDEWCRGHISIMIHELLGLMALDLKDLCDSLRQEWAEAIEKRIGGVQSENTEVKALLGSALAKLNAAESEMQQQRAEIAALRRAEERRTTRDATLVERSGRIAELQRQNAASHAELAREQRDRELAARDHRIDLLEARVEALLRHIGLMGLEPRGGF